MQVRLTAQRIITDHLTLPAGISKEEADQLIADATQTLWPDLGLDLTGAILFDFQLSRGHLRVAIFGGARFSGGAGFGGATFSGGAGFGAASFSGAAGFRGATFSGGAGFGGAGAKVTNLDRDHKYSWPAGCRIEVSATDPTVGKLVRAQSTPAPVSEGVPPPSEG